MIKKCHLKFTVDNKIGENIYSNHRYILTTNMMTYASNTLHIKKERKDKDIYI